MTPTKLLIPLLKLCWTTPLVQPGFNEMPETEDDRKTLDSPVSPKQPLHLKPELLFLLISMRQYLQSAVCRASLQGPFYSIGHEERKSQTYQPLSVDRDFFL